jgi:hypothetical protein
MINSDQYNHCFFTPPAATLRSPSAAGGFAGVGFRAGSGWAAGGKLSESGAEPWQWMDANLLASREGCLIIG